MNNINLVPLDYQRFLRRRWHIISGIIGGIIGVLVLGFTMYLPVYQINIAKEEQVSLDVKLNSPVLIEVKDIIEEISSIQKEKLNLEQCLKIMKKPSHVSRKTMDIIVAHVPDGIRINQITIDRLLNTAIIGGNAENISNVAQYMAGLYNTKQFQEITYKTSQNSEVDYKWEFGYEIKIQLKPFQEDIRKESVDVEREVFDE